MNLTEYFVRRWESEQKAFGKVLRAMPGDQLAYRPHERSTAAGDLRPVRRRHRRVIPCHRCAGR